MSTELIFGEIAGFENVYMRMRRIKFSVVLNGRALCSV